MFRGPYVKGLSRHKSGEVPPHLFHGSLDIMPRSGHAVVCFWRFRMVCWPRKMRSCHLPGILSAPRDGYSAYPLAAMEFAKKLGKDFAFKVTQVIGLTNDDAVSTEHRPFKQMIERLNRTYKASYRHTNGFDSIDGANYDLALWVAYYNFLRPHKHNK